MRSSCQLPAASFQQGAGSWTLVWRPFTVVLAMALLLVANAPPAAEVVGLTTAEAARPSIRLEDLTWPEAERHLTPDSVVLLPLGAAAKEHGPHLKLRNDLTLADHLTERVMNASRVLVAPALTYHFYPASSSIPDRRPSRWQRRAI